MSGRFGATHQEAVLVHYGGNSAAGSGGHVTCGGMIAIATDILYNNLMVEYIIELTWDDEASVWIAENDDIPIAFEADSLDKLIERVRIATPELLELNGKNTTNCTLHFKMEHQTMVA